MKKSSASVFTIDGIAVTPHADVVWLWFWICAFDKNTKAICWANRHLQNKSRRMASVVKVYANTIWSIPVHKPYRSGYFSPRQQNVKLHLWLIEYWMPIGLVIFRSSERHVICSFRTAERVNICKRRCGVID